MANATPEQVVEVAQDIFVRGVQQGELTPANPVHQVLALGAMLIIAFKSHELTTEQGLELVDLALERFALDKAFAAKRESRDDSNGYL